MYIYIGLYKDYMSYSRNSLKGFIYGIIQGRTIGDLKGDTGS